MGVYIAAIHMAGGSTHEHVSEVIWMNETSFESGKTLTAEMVKYIDDGNSVRVSDGNTRVSVGVVRERGKAPFLRTYADKKWTDNLLALPKY